MKKGHICIYHLQPIVLQTGPQAKQRLPCAVYSQRTSEFLSILMVLKYIACVTVQKYDCQLRTGLCYSKCRGKDVCVHALVRMCVITGVIYCRQPSPLPVALSVTPNSKRGKGRQDGACWHKCV
jgi:hypothetical protein